SIRNFEQKSLSEREELKIFTEYTNKQPPLMSIYDEYKRLWLVHAGNGNNSASNMIDNHSENENGCQVYQLTIGNPRYNISWKIANHLAETFLAFPISIAFPVITFKCLHAKSIVHFSVIRF
ncbi:hypothetical protein ACJX0J_036272, partial [Zea mays]